MIGREPELAQLEALLESPGAVVISGAPGIGKTTLWRRSSTGRATVGSAS